MVFDTVMSIYDDCPSVGWELDCNDDDPTGMSSYSLASLISLNVVSGETYYIVVEGYSSSPTSGDVDITQDLVYDCSGNALSATTGGSTTGGSSTCTTDGSFSYGSAYTYPEPTNNQLYPTCNMSNATPEYVMDYVPSSSGCVTFSTDSMYEDTILAVYDDCPSSGVELACDDDSGISTYGTSEVAVDVVSGETYYVLLEGASTTLSYGLISSTLDVGNSCIMTGGTSSGGSTGGGILCDDSCQYAFDGYCDDAYDPNYNGSSFCLQGTDCSDCSLGAIVE